MNTIYKLYHIEHGYKCKVIYPELVFLFGISENMTVDAINAFIAPYGYSIRG